MCFYMEKKHQANPPTPVDPDVKIVTNKEFTVYVHRFGGYAMKDAVNIREAQKFAEVLDNDGVEVDKSFFYTAGYDSPMKFWSRSLPRCWTMMGWRWTSPSSTRPATPVDPDVKIVTNKEFTVYVHRFGGYAMKDAVNIREAQKFAEVLDNVGVEVDKSFFYTAGYDSPMKFWNRRNEIMYLVPGGR